MLKKEGRMRILLVEDSLSLSDALKTVLQKEKYEVEAAFDGEMGLSMALENIFDLIILDVLMPKKNGFEVLSEIRKQGLSVPILMLTALSQEKDKIKGLDTGADDYLAKPFSIPELLARVRALTRRKGEIIENNELVFMETKLSLTNHTLYYKDKSVKLSVKEFNIMHYFFTNPKMVAEKEKMIYKVWGFENDFESNNLEVYISFLRRKLNFLNTPFQINSIRGIGYQLLPKQI